MVYTLRFFFSPKCSLFHNSNVFGSCFIYILYIECAKIKKKNNSGAKRLGNLQTVDSTQRNNIISVHDLHDIPHHVSVIAAISRRTGYTQIMTDAAAARCAVLV